MSEYLPPGCTDADCEPYNPTCANCGHYSDAHYEEDDDYINFPNKRDTDYDGQGVELNSNGEVTHACDAMINTKTKAQCGCTEFVDGEYEPYDERI